MNIFEEAIRAARGVGALLGSDKKSEQYFDNSYHGLAGATIALLLSLTISAYLPSILGMSDEKGLSAFEAIIFASSLYLIQIGAAAIVFNQIARLDALMIYLIADFWTTFFITIILNIPLLFGVKSSFYMLVVAISTIIIKINIMRLIVKISIMQIVMFFIAQLAAGFVGLIILSKIFGIDLVETGL